MIKTPQVFLFDEPLSNLDAKLRGSLRVEIARLHKDLKTTSIYVTHDQLEAMTLADRIVLMKDGRIEQMGTPEEIYQSPQTLFAAGFIGTPNMNFIELESINGALSNGQGQLDAPFAVRPGQVTAGIRPGNFKLRQEGGRFRGLVLRNEFHGETRLVTVRVGGDEVNVSVPAVARLAEGETVGLDVDAQDLHLFDPMSGKRLS